MFCLYRKPLLFTQCLVLSLLQIAIGIVDGYTQTTSGYGDKAAMMHLINTGIQQRTQDKDTALTLLQKGLAQSREANYIDGIAYALYEISSIYHEWNQQEDAIKFNKQALLYARRSVSYRNLVPAIYNNIGYSYIGKGDYTNAINYFDSSVKEGLRINLPKERRHLAITLNNLGGIHVKLNQPEKALPFLDQAEAICRNRNFPEQLALTLSNKAAVYDKLGESTKAEYHYKAAIQLAGQYNDIESMTNLISFKSGLVELKLKQNKAHQALILLNEIERLSQSFQKEYKKEYNSITPAYLKGKAWFQLGDYTQAVYYILKAIDEANAINNKGNLINMHQTLSQVYDSIGNHKKSLTHYRIYEQLKDTLLSKEKVRDINEIDAKYRTAEKDRDIARKQLMISRQQLNIERTRLLAIGMAIFFLLLTGIALLIYRHKRRTEQRDKEIERLKANMEGEENERKRIARELHDGVGGILTSAKLTLDNLQLKPSITGQDIGSVAELLQEMGDEVHRTAHNLMPDILEDQDLWYALQAYCDQVEEASGIVTDLQAHGDTHNLDKRIALPLYRIAQELLQNVVKHSGATELSVQLRYEPEVGKLYLSIEDNGKGFDTSATHNGLGLKNIRERVKVLSGFISIESSAAMGTTAYLEIDVGKGMAASS